MNQVLHIFRKDTRHFWPEILISLTMLGILASIGPYAWVRLGYVRYSPAQLMLAQIARYAPFLVYFVWTVLIARVIQEESLAGDNQFWITRPYRWPSLLAAKALFLVVFLYLPLFLAQCVLMQSAGFSPLADPSALLLNFLYVTVILVLPLVALATITSTFARMVLSLVAILAAIMCYSILRVSFHPLGVSITLPRYHDFQIVTSLCLLLIAIVAQYAIRNITLSRTLLAMIPLLMLTNVQLQTFTGVYRLETADSPLAVNLAYHPGVTVEHISQQAPGRIAFGIPLQAYGAADGTALSPEAVTFTLVAPDGSSWTSPWQPVLGQHFRVETSSNFSVQDLSVSMPNAVYEQFKTAPLTLHVTVAVAVSEISRVVSIASLTSETRVPGVGICRASERSHNRNNLDGLEVDLFCRSALRIPELVQVVRQWSGPSCPSSAEHDDCTKDFAWSQQYVSDPPTASFNPIQIVINFNQNIDYGHPEGAGPPFFASPSTAMVFNEYKTVRRAQTSITIPNFQLPSFGVAPE